MHKQWHTHARSPKASDLAGLASKRLRLEVVVGTDDTLRTQYRIGFVLSIDNTQGGRIP